MGTLKDFGQEVILRLDLYFRKISLVRGWKFGQEKKGWWQAESLRN